MIEKKQVGIVDRAGWPSGPWDDEPDRIEWRDEATGLPCIVLRQDGGHLCGYVGVNPDHPLHSRSYNCRVSDGASPESILRVHGGVTYSALRDGDVYHLAEEGEPDEVYWFGFDAAHSGDAKPKYDGPDGWFAKRGLPSMNYNVYRDVAYMQAECASLAKQLADFGENEMSKRRAEGDILTAQLRELAAKSRKY